MLTNLPIWIPLHASLGVAAVVFAQRVGEPTFLIITLVVILAGVGAWVARGSWLRGVRLLNGALTGTIATITTVAFSLTVTMQSEVEDPGFAMLVVLLTGAAFSTWVADWYIKSAEDARAEERHVELMAEIQASQVLAARDTSPKPDSRSIRIFDLVVLVFLWHRGR